MKKLNKQLKRGIFTAFSGFRKTILGIQYLALIAGFMVLAPFSQANFDSSTLALTAENDTNALINDGSTTLMARSSTVSYGNPKIPVNIYERYITAYSSTPDETDSTPFITASGNYVHFGVIAANWLPIGTAVRIPKLFGKQVFIVEDRMNRRNPYKVDIWLPTKEAAINFGKRLSEIEVL